MSQWTNQIVGHADVDPRKLLAHPANFRVHPPGQRIAVSKAVSDQGWVRTILVNRRTGKMLDGHLRVDLAIGAKQKTVPVDYVDLDELAEARILASLDPLGAMAETDEQRLAALTALFDTEFAPILPPVSMEPAPETPNPAAEEPEEPVNTGIYSLREDAKFSSTNEWGIPDLIPGMLSEQVPTTIWAGGPIEKPEDMLYLYRTSTFPAESAGGVLAFYVDDYRFEAAWKQAVQFVGQLAGFGWGSVITPDFSVWQDDPVAVQLFNIYRSRWCARYWQEAGVKVIPSLNWSDERSYKFAHAGIPQGIPVASVQCRTTRSKKGQEFFLKGIADAATRVKPKKLLIYGGEQSKPWLEGNLPGGTEYVYLNSWTHMRRHKKEQ